MEHYDVIIVGAGPAGLKCAETLGNSEYKVLLLEKNSEIGPKVCAGALSNKTIDYLNLPRHLIDAQYNKINIHINNFKFQVKNKDSFAYTVDRKNLGQWQLKKLEKFNNVKVETNAIVSKIKDSSVVVNGRKIAYKYLVGADGSASIVKRHLGIKLKDVGIAIQYIIPTEKYREFEIFFNSRLFSAWYAWIFPHKGYVSVGCGGDPKTLPSKDLIANFHKWLKENKIDISDAKYEAFMIDVDHQGYQFDNVFLAGDAAGLTSELTGEGIYQALVSGEEIGKEIIDKNYKPQKIDDLLQIKEKHGRLMNLLIKSGKFRVIFVCLGVLLLKIPYLKRKAIDFLS